MGTKKYELKCRRCGIIVAHEYVKNPKLIKEDYLEKMRRMVDNPPLVLCKQCGIDTVQDLVSYTRFSPLERIKTNES